MKNIKKLIVFSVILLIFFAIISIIAYYNVNSKLIQNDYSYKSLNIALERFFYSPKFYLENINSELIKMNSNKLDNSILFKLKKSFNASIVYVMDTTGKVIASTNSKLMGNNYGFRPYFIKAKKGEINLFNSVGVTTHKRGVYLAGPIIEKGIVKKVLVFKVNLDYIDDIVKNISTSVYIVDKDGVVFSSNNQNSILKKFESINNEKGVFDEFIGYHLDIENLHFMIYFKVFNLKNFVKFVVVLYLLYLIFLLIYFFKLNIFEYKHLSKKVIISTIIFIFSLFFFVIVAIFTHKKNLKNREINVSNNYKLIENVLYNNIKLNNNRLNSIVKFLASSNVVFENEFNNFTNQYKDKIYIQNLNLKQKFGNKNLVIGLENFNNDTIIYKSGNLFKKEYKYIKNTKYLFIYKYDINNVLKNIKDAIGESYLFDYKIYCYNSLVYSNAIDIDKNEKFNKFNIYNQIDLFINLRQIDYTDDIVLYVFVFVGVLFSIFVSIFYYFFSNSTEALKKIVMSKTSQLERLLEQKRKNEENLKKMTYIVEQSPIGIVMTDVEANILYVNKSFEEITGYEFDELIGKNPRVLKSDNYDLKFYEDMWNKLVHGGIVKEDFINIHKDGSEYYQRDVIVPLFNKDKVVIGYVGFAEDVTDQVTVQKEKENMELQLRQSQKMEAIGELAAGIAHEINTPMQYISNNIDYINDSLSELLEIISDFLKEDNIEQLKEKLEEFDIEFFKDDSIEAIKQSKEGVKKITEIVKAMRDFSHPGQKHKSVENIKKIAQNSIIITKNQWKYVATVEENYPEQDMELLCYPQELGQMFINLIVNAAHAIEDVVKDKGELGVINVSLTVEEDFYIVSIKDTGTGIKEENKDKIFNPFFTTKEVGKGTGQGLAFVHKIVKKHNGFVSVKSKWGEGTEFIIRLPKVVNDQEDGEQEDV